MDLPSSASHQYVTLVPSVNREAAQSTSSSATSLSLLARVKHNESEAWHKLVNRYSPLVYHWCRESGLPESDAADSVQEVFASVFGGIGNFHRDQQGDSFRGWLRTITRNCLCNHFRKVQGMAVAEGGSNARMNMLAFPDALSDDSLNAVLLDENSMIVQAVLDQIRGEFEDRTWRMFWAVTIDQLYPVDVAAQFAVSTGAVYKAKSRVLQRLREELAGTLVDGERRTTEHSGCEPC
jgi:RNA polymerase sigma-70 factor, ECF subfamily